MDRTVAAILGEAVEKETRTYTVTSRPEHLDKIEQLFSWINMTRQGHSGGASIQIDGDGAARVKIEKVDGELIPYSEDEIKSAQRIEFNVGLD